MTAKAFLTSCFVACQIVAISGCAAFEENASGPGGETEPFEQTDPIPAHSEIVAATARLQQRGNSVVVGLALDVKDTYQRKRKTVGASVQEVVVGSETRSRGVFAKGPYFVEISIPILDDYREEKRLSERDGQVVFELPFVEQDRSVDVVVTFRDDPNARSGSMTALTQSALALTAGREWSFPISIRGMGRVDPPRSQTNNTQERTGQQTDLPLEVLDIRPYEEGRYVVRVKVKDRSKTFGIGRLVETEAKRQMLKSYLADNPNTPIQHIRETGKISTEENGAVLVYTGWVFSVRPVEDGWGFDTNTRRGWVRLRMSGGMPAKDAKRWARENIAAIVADKNVSLEADQAPPPGAQYRSLSESFEDGVLSVEFEAVQ